MDKPVSKVVKSKSSNSTGKSEPRKSENNKKTRSNVKFQHTGLKKRGVYVEKKDTIISINEQDHSGVVLQKRTSSPRPIPRPSKKRFLTSVLTILSQSTTGTQYPDQHVSDTLKKLNRSKSKLRKKKEEMIREDSNTTSANSSKKKSRYRSRVFNNNDSELEQLVVLQSTKEITHTPSNYSGKSDYKDSSNVLKSPDVIKWADILPPLVKNENLDVIPAAEGNRIQETINEARVINLVDKDPSTVIAQMPKKEEKKLYNFFVDLLETTFSVYNMKTQFIPPPPSSLESSKVDLEMDESIAKKLNIQKINATDDVTRKLSSKYFCIKPDVNTRWDDRKLLEHFQPKSMFPRRLESQTKLFKRKEKLPPEKIEYRKVPITYMPYVTTKKHVLKKQRKNNFINYLKEQLKMDDDAFKEPQNIYQALKIIARNKKRCQKSIHFHEPKKTSSDDIHICQFKRRGLLSGRTKPSRKKPIYHPQTETIQPYRSYNTRNTPSIPKKKTIITGATENYRIPSHHSLEVLNYDYEPNNNKKVSNLHKVAMSFVSSEHDDDSYINESILKFSDSGSSSMMTTCGPFSTKHGLRSLRGLIK